MWRQFLTSLNHLLLSKYRLVEATKRLGVYASRRICSTAEKNVAARKGRITSASEWKRKGQKWMISLKSMF